MARRAGLAVRADRLRRGLIRRRRRQPQNIRSSRAASKRTTTLPAGDRTYLVLAKPNVIMTARATVSAHSTDCTVISVPIIRRALTTRSGPRMCPFGQRVGGE
jgi:hypothetical protein